MRWSKNLLIFLWLEKSYMDKKWSNCPLLSSQESVGLGIIRPNWSVVFPWRRIFNIFTKYNFYLNPGTPFAQLTIFQYTTRDLDREWYCEQDWQIENNGPCHGSNPCLGSVNISAWYIGIHWSHSRSGSRAGWLYHYSFSASRTIQGDNSWNFKFVVVLSPVTILLEGYKSPKSRKQRKTFAQ